ncbi:unnamed protein product [Ambrosiozyma monospora]|uniref:Unnamed protein product n=1 Tax=Ambrosiozyma monospora TaxID=43982 RepID=A0ACB5TUC2_AMBMO|nr:unnamed protein product [Ambrosiozyma monospora]
MLIDGFYQANFLNSRRVRQNGMLGSIASVERLGGDFKNVILADSNFQADEETDSQQSISKDDLRVLEKRYLGELFEDDELADQSSDDEFDLDPIVNSEDEAIEAKRKVVETLEAEDWDDWDESEVEDAFSDDDLAMQI